MRQIDLKIFSSQDKFFRISVVKCMLRIYHNNYPYGMFSEMCGGQEGEGRYEISSHV